MTDQELLNAVFRFKHKAPSDRQEAATCEMVVKWFAEFVVTLEAEEVKKFKCRKHEPLADDRVVPASSFAVHEVEVLQEVSRRLTGPGGSRKRGDMWYKWLPQYGCALQWKKLNAILAKLEVIYVDGWEQTLHFLPTGECVHAAIPTLHKVFHCADLDTEMDAKFEAAFASELQKARERKGFERSAAQSNMVHQKTPQFIVAVVKRAVASIQGTPTRSILPKGGTTDVGMHTGGQARDTCWSLVQAAIEQNICCGRGLFRKTMVAIKLKLIEEKVHEAKNAFSLDCIDVRGGCESLDDMFHMLQVLVLDIVDLLECGYDVSSLETQCSALKSSIGGFADALNSQTAAKYALPDVSELEQLDAPSSDMSIMSPRRDEGPNRHESNQERHNRAWANLEGCCFVDGASCTLMELLNWKGSNTAPASYKSILILRTFETFMYSKSLRLCNNDGTNNEAFSLESLQTLVTEYQQIVKEWRQLPRLTYYLDVGQRSREMLVMWTAFCLAHQQLVSEVPLCAKYNIALDWRDLKVVVLRDRTAISALQHVARYIRSWNDQTKGKPLFHLTDQESTFDFGRKFGLSSTSMMDIYYCEVRIWEAHESRKWNEIEQKKTAAASLRSEIRSENLNLAAQQLALANEEKRIRLVYPDEDYYWRCRRSSLRTQLKTEVNCISSLIDRKEAALKRTIVVPPYLKRPLPAALDDAIQVIFMLTMPRHLEILGSLCLTAQRVLAPAEATDEMKRLPELSSVTWQQYHALYAPSQALYPTIKVLTLSPATFTLPSSLGPKSVDGLYSISQFRSECVWNPRLCGTALTWLDAEGSKINPFAATNSSVIDSFTERVPRRFEQFQWMNEWPGEGSTRGNMVYANLHQQPEDFEKVSFITLGSLRAFPHQQYRKLQSALLDDILPWSHPCVETIVRQALYQVGILTDEIDPRMLWKYDMLQDDNGIKTFCATLDLVASKLEQTPRRFESVPLVSELAGYVLQFADDARSIVKLFAGMARRWAENARSEYMNESSPSRVATIRQKECILYGYSLLAFTLGPLDDEAAHEICELIVLFRTSFLCASINVVATKQMVRVECMIAEMMSRRISAVTAYVNRRGTHAVLTALVRLVSATSPARLKWEPFSELVSDAKQFGVCFEATGDTHYSINLFTGMVLTDGYAPGGLPAEIREHERFQSLFGRCNFEVFTMNGVLRTERTYCDRLYDFALQDEGELYIQEVTSNESRRLQLCSVTWIEKMSRLIPARLTKLYSHWYWVEQNCVIFRPKLAKSREVFYVATFDESSHSKCYRIPFCDTKGSYEEIVGHLDNYDRFVQREEPLLKRIFEVLTKFEDEHFLHTLKSPKDVVKIELPRFRLTFHLNSSGKFESMEHKGYVLATSQQFDDFLQRFSRYLVLELQDHTDTSRPELRMLVPVGPVVESTEAMVDIEFSSDPDGVVDVACYDVHRRLKTFETETIGARLQLAAVCARAGTSVPSKRLQMTGAEAAVQLLHACRSSRPFASSERDTLLTICKLSYRESAVKILAVALLAEADRLAFLHGRESAVNTGMDSVEEQTEYADMCIARFQRNPLRSHLRSGEEDAIIGHVKHNYPLCSTTDCVSCESLPDTDDFVHSTENELKLFVQIDGSTTTLPSLPLETTTTNAMGKVMLDELQVSWKSYHSQTRVGLKAAPAALLGSFETLLSVVSSRRIKMQTYLESVFAKATGSRSDCLLALVNFVPHLTVSDIVRCAFDDETLLTLVPRLSTKAREFFKKASLRYMELCVLEDKVERLVWKAKRSGEISDAQLIDELVNVRQWSSTEFPFWLAFEVEGRLQIRHEQFVIAQHLIKSPGTVCQLNMGRGKTRVILPMLFLYFTRSRCPRVVRAHFLGPLLSEARQFMHRYLSASNACLGIFELPFHRQIDLNSRRLDFIRDAIEEMKMFGGIQMVAPEHRMSLELKRLELGDNAAATTLDEILDNDQYVDVLDECDALLHHKNHLVYAVGIPIPLCSGMERWMAAEALLRVVACELSSGPRVATVLGSAHVSCTAPDYATRLGAYRGTRLNTVVESTEMLRKTLKTVLVLDLIDNAPFELMWLNTFGKGDARASLVAAITDSTLSVKDSLGCYMEKLSPYILQLYALRGFVAFGVLEHCLEKRYRVDFGLPPAGTRPKKIAIPYRAADVPSERSEFSHPDVCIVLTLLGYYHGGLADEETRNAFKMLLRLDISEQDQLYGRWYDSVKGGLDDDDKNALKDVRHISLADARQFEILCKVYKFCMETINFYLNTCVFPKDTQQYPQRLSRTAWNLAAGANIIGFSGTNDNHLLLPLSVTQQEPDEPAVVGTNGKMIDKIVQETHGYEVIRPSLQHTPIPWQSVLRFSMDKGAQALIDTGALLAGVSNHDAAEFLLQQQDFKFDGVTYYDSRGNFNCWMIAEKARRINVPLKKAAMLEKETFVLFDEARSRGSDMKLLPDAAAVLTLGPKLTKDKLMQGAGRMRQLGCKQTLWIASFDEVAQSMLQTSRKSEVSCLTAVDVLNWVMDNTKAEAVRGLLEWAGNGVHFRKTQSDRAKEIVDDNWALKTLYQDKLYTDKIANVIQEKARFHFKDSGDELIAKICRRGFTYGLDDEVCITSHTDECERELQVEEEIQQQRVVEVIRCSPAKEKSWNYKYILRARSIDKLKRVVNVLGVKDFISQRVYPKELASLAWADAAIFGTENYFSTIVARRNMHHLNEFLRAVDVLLVFKNGQVLLVSEYEADRILGLLWSNQEVSPTCSFRFINLKFASESIDRVGVGAKFQDIHLSLGTSLDQNIPLLSITACNIYNGETVLAKNQRNVVKPAFHELLNPLAQRETTLSNFVKSRGNSHKWKRSFLHELCCQMDLKSAESVDAK
ncbi:unnamed protein product [Phytophthora lilii]|uniref:ubiquitinyl hydrolase 1 n=1 Tax=Phytophthora lilii TaxID=2077276 RepID=A0A9W6WRF1_9STRA|nr:unnamed protein product [Phytophthora lilii]